MPPPDRSPFALKYTNGTASPVTYYYILNLQGDVLGLINASGTLVARYTYNAWGELTYSSGSMAEINPLRYRGYYYDTETGFYYLQSRYYDPVTHRFINADSLASTGQGIIGTNMFAYCGNNPTNREDPTGHVWWLVVAVVAVATLCLAGCSDSSGQTAPDTGAASPYTPSSSTSVNCYGYALGEDEWRYVGGSPEAVEDYNVYSIADMVIDEVQKTGRTIRIIESYNSPIEDNEYRIALRTGIGDYHFMVQHSDGSWSHKPGICETRLIDGLNPDEVSWDLPQIDSRLFYYHGIVKEVSCISGYYDSDIIYFAVSE